MAYNIYIKGGRYVCVGLYATPIAHVTHKTRPKIWGRPLRNIMDRTQQMTAGEVALEANVSTRTVYRWIDRGLPCTKYSSRLIRIKRSDFDDWKKGLSNVSKMSAEN